MFESFWRKTGPALRHSVLSCVARCIVDRYERAVIILLALAYGLVLSSDTAQAQIGSSCLRPLALPDRWEERQTPPWDELDSFDRYDPSGGVIENPDIYRPPSDPAPTGYVPDVDQGRFVQIRLGIPTESRGGFALPIIIGSDSGGDAFRAKIEHCAGEFVETGYSLLPEPGNLIGPFLQGFSSLIARDPDAYWDPTAHDNRGDVVNSAYSISPRLIALPVYDPDLHAQEVVWGRVNITVVRIVGLFVSGLVDRTLQGYLTGWSTLSTDPVSGTFGEPVTLAASVDGPGAPVSGVSVDFSVAETYVGSAPLLDGRVVLSGVQLPGLSAGTYPNTVVASLGSNAGFFLAAAAAADLTIERAPSQVALTSSLNPSTYGEEVKLTALVTAAVEIPKGTVEFLDGAELIGIAPVTTTEAGAVAVFGTDSLTPGVHKLSARFSGSTNLLESTSDVLVQYVLPRHNLDNSLAGVRQPRN